MLGAEPGDRITLVIDRNSMTFQATVVRNDSLSRDWETVGRITGTGEQASMESLARALHCTPREVGAILRGRDDPTWRCLPPEQRAQDRRTPVTAGEYRITA